MPKREDYNIYLSHIETSLDINNPHDVKNIDRILSKVIKAKDNKEELIEILCNTSMKYLKRFQEDSLIKDTKGHNLVPINDPKVTDKALSFYKDGGYSSLYESESGTNFKKVLIKLLITVLSGVVVWLIIQFVLLPLI